MSALKKAIDNTTYEVLLEIISDEKNHIELVYELVHDRLAELEDSEEAWKYRMKGVAKDLALRRFEKYKETGDLSQYDHPIVDEYPIDEDY